MGIISNHIILDKYMVVHDIEFDEKLGKEINSMTPVSEVPFPTR